MDDLRETLRWAVEHETGVSIDAVRRRARQRRNRRRAIGVTAAAAVVVFALVGAVLALDRSGDSAQTVEVVGPPEGVATNELPPVGDDPMVSCFPDQGLWFPYSGLSNPKGAENDPDPAAEALRRYLHPTEWNVPTRGDPQFSPDTGWRRVRESETGVLFEADSPLPPEWGMREDILGYGIVEVELQNGQWEPIDGHGGTGCDFRVQPPDGMSMALWSLDDSDPPSPSSTELQLSVTEYPPGCVDSPLTADDVAVGVVETPDDVTIRVEIDRPPLSEQEAVEQMMECGNPLEDQSVAIVVPLEEPLGDRLIFDANVFPPRREPAEAPTGDPVVTEQSTVPACGAVLEGPPPSDPTRFQSDGPSGFLEGTDWHVAIPAGGDPIRLQVHMSLAAGATLDHLAFQIEGEGEVVSAVTPPTPIEAGEHDFEIAWDGGAVPGGSYRLAAAYTVGQDERDPCDTTAGGNWKRGLGWLDVTE
jgi:hypothetical protein